MGNLDHGAVSEAPDRLAYAEQLIARGDYRSAHALATQVLRETPRTAGAWFLLGVVAADHANVAKAAELFAKAEALNPDDPRAPAQLARCLVAMSQTPEALAAVARAEALAPRDALTRDTIGVVLSRAGLHARAIPHFEAAVAAEPKNASFLYNLAASRQFCGDFDGAEAAYARTLTADPEQHRAWSQRVQLRRQTPGANHLEVLERLAERPSDDADRALHLAHALAKTYEDLGRPEAALAALARGKAAKRRAEPYDPEADAQLFVSATATFPSAAATGGFASEAPVFIVGLPRTGTTLIDRVLSSHPQVASAGELTDFAVLVKRAAGTPGNLMLDAATLEAAALDLTDVGRRYVERVAQLGGGAARVIDKMPINVLYAGLIHRALPNARIICLRRHPMDACLANYRQLFATGFRYYDYALDLADAGRYYLQFDRLAAHWRDALPSARFTEVWYEDVVADLEGQSRRLLAFLGLDWDPRCLDFHRNEAPVATASAVQVRQPLYATSVGRWRSYGQGLAPLRRVLEAGGIRID